ncbi:MAG: hypothetical protein IJS88_03540 [Alphaproteobacteria bacterium]|nr:hypothetical protein [Alphaproteobacteria bacterium]
MRLYHYAPKVNTVKEKGLLSISKGSRDLRAYAHRAGSENRDEIMAWLDRTFAGRSRAISCLTEPIKWQGNDAVLKAIVDRSALFSFELEDLLKAGLVKSIWCKNGSEAGGYNEKFFEVKPEDIDLSPLTWEKVDAAKDLLYAVVRHYLIVLKDGCIPPQYLREES